VHAARGGTWEAVEAEPRAGRVVAVRQVKAGWTESNTWSSPQPSTQSSTPARAGQRLREVKGRLQSARVPLCSGTFACTPTGSSARVQPTKQLGLRELSSGQVTPFPLEGRAAVAPSADQHKLLLRSFPNPSLPTGRWHVSSRLAAHTKVAVYVDVAEGGNRTP